MTMPSNKPTFYPTIYTIPLLAVTLLFVQACSNNANTEPSETKTVTESKRASEPVHTKAKKAAQNQLLTATQAGNFSVGQQIHAGKQETGEMVKQKTITHMEEGEQIERHIFEVYSDDRVALEIKDHYDYKTKQSNNTIREITVLSPAYKTVEGIGVGSTLSQALEAYPQGVLYYSYVCDCIWLENGTQYAMQFHIDKAHYQKTLPTHYDSVEIQPADVSSSAKIYKVRIFGT